MKVKLVEINSVVLKDMKSCRMKVGNMNSCRMKVGMIVESEVC
jgi:hypothetical protein